MGIEKRAEVLFWSIAFPGFGQFLNKKYVKGFFFIILEFTINVQARLNFAIIPSFYGKGELANASVDYQWIMFYPCVYIFSMYDAYRDAGGKAIRYAFIPFVTSAYFGTVGIIFSQSITISNHLIGVIWSPILFHLSGYVVGLFIRKLIMIIFRKQVHSQ
ncbi:hypothetical protein [Halalkalibacter hemicellulosilyticus]|uniref:Uncharacterized protein n=1 Tax=Halalkalibacter hemicellulosilyticusJCM 9152 TaxID=1236971 RepID=W4QFA3_9BACI|nr:hypothetical protein [Halalkalibacter hemicellulosilyticus]GAE30761.1 hypothetical protein JCM9152_2177 [Halalkalibacter hemicellulosilyticusJCM 9152]